MKPLWAAITFLTRIPVPIRVDEAAWRNSPVYYPLVGLIVGGLAAAFDWGIASHFPPWVRGVLVIGWWVLITGGLHMDGLMDTADGLGSYRNRERMLEIMKDSRIGAMGVLAAIFLIFIKVSVAASVPLSASLAAPLILAPVWGRFALVWALAGYPYLREKGMGTGLHVTRSSWLIAFLFSLGLTWVIVGVSGGVLALAAIAMTALFCAWVTRRLGGLTGDVYGALVEIVETVVLLTWLGWMRGNGL
ncbi:adenosylcobinamide-GDP ribazoletransferase [Marinithermofilum abyssi]|uniref:Adenosylcobinamide-GDP ribazoletransferase n=1 Tax=Marinithermofilum abyssi TaxID=1571185 RepID=A0A8J2VG95_9BACL|nr:adenosylcobinamide-GDP ribazoletransferase [Marinithermofilum abyssi]GGE07713.1 adenosylcobinamide-GDP ribazoletransferase [Marinithermofilum abyssi]